MKRDILKINKELCNGCGECVPNCHEGGECPGSRAMVIEKPSDSVHGTESAQSELRQWPVQMHLINPNSSYFGNSDLLLAADCVAYSESLWLPV